IRDSGTTTVAINSAGGSIVGAVPGDDVQLRATGVTGSIADKHVGTGKAVTVTGLSLAGADAANYTAASGGGKAFNQVQRQLGHVGRDRRDMGEGANWWRRRSPGIIHGRQKPGQRPERLSIEVCDNGQAKAFKPRRITVSVQYQPVHLRAETLDYVAKQRIPGKRTKALITTAHAARRTACEDHTEDMGAAEQITSHTPM
ncbi:MAG: YDG domain-containing protein, partial [Hyphomicrobium sp.]